MVCTLNSVMLTKNRTSKMMFLTSFQLAFLFTNLFVHNKHQEVYKYTKATRQIIDTIGATISISETIFLLL